MILETKLKKSTLALSALTLALAAGLSACGGGSSTYTIGGVVRGLEYGPLILVTNGMEVSIEPKRDAQGNLQEVSYSFPNQLEYGEAYDVNLKQIGTDTAGNPIYQYPPHQICGQSQVPGTSTRDTAGRLSVINAAFDCVLVQNRISGSVTGLTSEGLVLTNGSNGGTASVLAKAETFSFEIPVTYGQTYGVTVLRQPEGATCTVTNGAGKMGDNPVNNIAVACRPNA